MVKPTRHISFFFSFLEKAFVTLWDCYITRNVLRNTTLAFFCIAFSGSGHNSFVPLSIHESCTKIESFSILPPFISTPEASIYAWNFYSNLKLLFKLETCCADRCDVSSVMFDSNRSTIPNLYNPLEATTVTYYRLIDYDLYVTSITTMLPLYNH